MICISLQILAGNARKVSAVRFERVNQDDESETKEVTRLFPKIMKKKWGADGDTDKADDGVLVKEIVDHNLSDDTVNAEQVDNHDHQIKQ